MRCAGGDQGTVTPVADPLPHQALGAVRPPPHLRCGKKYTPLEMAAAPSVVIGMDMMRHVSRSLVVLSCNVASSLMKGGPVWADCQCDGMSKAVDGSYAKNFPHHGVPLSWQSASQS